MSDTRPITGAGLHRITRMVGCTVENPAGETLGRLVDFVIDLGESRVAAAVFALANRAGLKELYVAVPVSALGFDPAEDKILLNVDRETFQKAPTFRCEEWPQLIDHAWVADLYAHYGCVPYWH